MRTQAKSYENCAAKAEHDAEEILRRNYRRYLKERDPAKKLEAGNDLIRSIFGADAIA